MPKLKRPNFIARQASRPRGLLGSLIGRIMVRETAPVNDRAVALLDLAAADHVLEIGFGPGRTIGRIAAAAPDGRVDGVEVSDTMLAGAAARNRAAIESGRVRLQVADAGTLPYEDDAFDKALSVHTIYFWDDAASFLAEIVRVLRPGGRLVLAFRPADDPDAQAFPDNVYSFYSPAAVENLALASGFAHVEATTESFGRGRVSFAVAETADRTVL